MESGWKLRVQPKEKNKGRKPLVIEIYPDKEVEAQDTEWQPALESGKTPVVVTGIGGIEVATFTQETGQDCHKHLIGTEIYTVLSGEMKIRLTKRLPAKAGRYFLNTTESGYPG